MDCKKIDLYLKNYTVFYTRCYNAILFNVKYLLHKESTPRNSKMWFRYLHTNFFSSTHTKTHLAVVCFSGNNSCSS